MHLCDRHGKEAFVSSESGVHLCDLHGKDALVSSESEVLFSADVSSFQAGTVEEKWRGRLEEQADSEAGIWQSHQQPAHAGGGAVPEEKGTVSTTRTPRCVSRE